MTRKTLLFLLSLTSLAAITAQTQPTRASRVLDALKQQQSMKTTSLVKNLRLENIGPSVMSGRVVDIEANPEKPSEFYVAYASGGLWYTGNNGTSFEPVMDNTPTQNLGDIAVHWPSGTIYAGTGENNSSRSSYAGVGIYKSADRGKTWSYIGLPDSHHIGKILIHPDRPEEITVGVAGHLYSPNSERGVYKSADGGATWKRTLFVDENTGIIDLATSPDNPEGRYHKVSFSSSDFLRGIFSTYLCEDRCSRKLAGDVLPRKLVEKTIGMFSLYNPDNKK